MFSCIGQLLRSNEISKKIYEILGCVLLWRRFWETKTIQKTENSLIRATKGVVYIQWKIFWLRTKAFLMEIFYVSLFLNDSLGWAFHYYHMYNTVIELRTKKTELCLQQAEIMKKILQFYITIGFWNKKEENIFDLYTTFIFAIVR